MKILRYSYYFNTEGAYVEANQGILFLSNHSNQAYCEKTEKIVELSRF